MNEIAAESLPLGQTVDLEDFGVRWRRARLSALRKFCATVPPQSTPQSTDEFSLLQNVDAEQCEDLLKSVYYNSRKLGLSALSHHNLLWELGDIPAVLAHAGVPCFSGSWSDGEPERKTLQRSGCELFVRCGRAACDFYREAVDGLLVGVGDEVRHVRHSSIGHGDVSCRDVFFGRTTSSPVYLPIPDHIQAVLKPIKLELESRHDALQIHFHGYAEGTVYCEVVFARRGCSAGAEEAEICLKLMNSLHEKFPELRIQNAAARSVFDRVTADKGKQGEKEKWNRIIAEM